MYHSGIGGGGFALVRQPNDNYEFVDFRETAPADVIEELYITNITDPMIGGAARYVIHQLIAQYPLGTSLILLDLQWCTWGAQRSLLSSQDIRKRKAVLGTVGYTSCSDSA